MTSLQPHTIHAPTLTPCQLREALESAWQSGYLCRDVSPPPGLTDLGQAAWHACYRRGQGRAVEEVARRAGDEDEGIAMEEEARP